MKVYSSKLVESLSDVLCDVCGASTIIAGGGPEFGTLSARWGYGSTHDGECYEVHLCEPCFFKALSRLKREREQLTMPNEVECCQNLRDFGRVSQDGKANDLDRSE